MEVMGSVVTSLISSGSAVLAVRRDESNGALFLRGQRYHQLSAIPHCTLSLSQAEKNTDAISPYPSALLLDSSLSCHTLSMGNTNCINYAHTHTVHIYLSRKRTDDFFLSETLAVHQL